MLTNILLKCKLAGDQDVSSDILDFSNKQLIAPGKGNEHQWRFKKTAKTPGRKKNNTLRSVNKYYYIVWTTTTDYPGMQLLRRRLRFWIPLMTRK